MILSLLHNPYRPKVPATDARQMPFRRGGEKSAAHLNNHRRRNNRSHRCQNAPSIRPRFSKTATSHKPVFIIDWIIATLLQGTWSNGLRGHDCFHLIEQVEKRMSHFWIWCHVWARIQVSTLFILFKRERHVGSSLVIASSALFAVGESLRERFALEKKPVLNPQPS